jgi:hypothetical protein
MTPSAAQASASFITGLKAHTGLAVKVQLTVREPLPPDAFPLVVVSHDSGVM